MDGAHSFEDVYRGYADQIHRFCLTQLGDPAVAEDVTSAVFVSVYAAFDRVPKDPDGFRPWIFRVARNAVIDQRRRQKRRKLLFMRLAAAESSASVEDSVAVRAELRSALDGMRTLRARDREMLGLRLGARLSVREIAAVMGMSEVAARSRLNRAVEKVRRYVEEHA